MNTLSEWASILKDSGDRLDKSEKEAFSVWVNGCKLGSEDPDEIVRLFRNSYFGRYDSEEDFALEELLRYDSEVSLGYFDLDEYTSDIFKMYYWYENGFVFRRWTSPGKW